MTLPQIIQLFVDQGDIVPWSTDKEKIAFLRSACPDLQYEARARTAEYYKLNADEGLTQNVIIRYIFNEYEFDTVDVSRICEAVKRRKPCL
jgi:hypothetical protein